MGVSGLGGHGYIASVCVQPALPNKWAVASPFINDQIASEPLNASLMLNMHLTLIV